MLQLVPTATAPETVRFSVHRFDDLDTAPFSTDDYSRMKFGADSVAKRFANEMAQVFFDQHRELLTTRCVVLPAPATTVPVASTMMTLHFIDRLNVLLDRAGMEPVEWSHVHRNFSFNDTYASADSDTRKEMLARDRTFLNTDYIENATIIFVDDVVITGAHENRMEAFVRDCGLVNQIVLAAYARYDGVVASTEMKLNHARIKTAADMVSLSMDEPDFRITTRGVRLMLGEQPQQFAFLLSEASSDFVRELYRCAIVKGYTRHEPYAANVQVLRLVVQEIDG
jgi:hypothetical protein